METNIQWRPEKDRHGYGSSRKIITGAAKYSAADRAADSGVDAINQYHNHGRDL